MVSRSSPANWRVWLILAVASLVLSVSIVVALVLVVGDPTLAIMGAGDYETVRAYYGPGLAICAFCLALVSPAASWATVPIFGFSQAGGIVLAMVLRSRPILDPSLWWLLLIIPLVLGTVLPWVFVGGAAGAAVRLGARAIAARASRSGAFAR